MQTVLQLQQFKNEGYMSYPVFVKESLTLTPEEILFALKRVSSHVFLLESADDQKNTGRYTFLGYEPKAVIACRQGKITISQGLNLQLDCDDPRPYIRKAIADNRGPKIKELPPFTGGLVGYFSYDYIRFSEPTLVLNGVDEEGFNDVDLMLFDRVIAIDHLENLIYYIVNVSLNRDLERELNRAILEIDRTMTICHSYSGTEKDGRLLEDLQPLFSKEEYCAMVKRAKRYIFEGDIFQCVLSNRWAARYEGSLFNVYRELKRANPSPYMFYFAGSDVEIAGASPETLVKLNDRKVTTYPLAGSRPRGKTAEEDAALERELLADEKERAEHNMLVDLGRNDLGKVCKFGTVKLEKYMNVERFSCIMHIGSTVSGELREDKSALDALDAVLPAGTLSGAPKLSACRIIAEAENNKRGIYGGAIGYFGYNGNMDTCISIRLAYKKNGRVYVRSGGGIVADSVPEMEYEESKNKARAVVRALGSEL